MSFFPSNEPLKSKTRQVARSTPKFSSRRIDSFYSPIVPAALFRTLRRMICTWKGVERKEEAIEERTR